jgi:hypothetical protein
MADPRVTLRALLDQPNSTVLDHPTPWVHFAPHLGGGMVAAGPARLISVVAAAVVSWVFCRRTGRPECVLWMVAVCFATRSLFEAVMVAYYIWPVLAVALVVAARGTRIRFAATCALSTFATLFEVHNWRHGWGWWAILVTCIAAMLLAAWPAGAPSRRRSMAAADQPAGSQRMWASGRFSSLSSPSVRSTTRKPCAS